VIVKFILSLLGMLLLASTLQGAEESKLSKIFSEAVTAKGDSYIRVRKEFEGSRTAAIRFLEAEVKRASSWDKVLQAQILLFRFNNIEKYKNLFSVLSHKNIIYRRSRIGIGTTGKLLAIRFRQAPLLLVECLWKGNEIDRLQLKSGTIRLGLLGQYPEKSACVARALGMLEERRAIPILLRFVEKGLGDSDGCERAGEALCDMGDPSAFPELIRIADQGKDSLAKITALRASAGTFSQKHVELVRKIQQNTKSAHLRLHCSILLSPRSTPTTSSSTARHAPDMIELARVSLLLNSSEFRGACEEQAKRCVTYLRSSKAWEKPAAFKTNSCLETVRILRLAAVAGSLAKNITYLGVPEEALSDFDASKRGRLYPAARALEAIGLPGVGAIIEVLASDCQSGMNKSTVELKKDLLLNCLVKILDHSGHGKRAARELLGEVARKSSFERKVVLQGLLDHKILAESEVINRETTELLGGKFWIIGLAAFLGCVAGILIGRGSAKGDRLK
jgi:hypothetical protein